jgi:hypothetical protein
LSPNFARSLAVPAGKRGETLALLGALDDLALIRFLAFELGQFNLKPRYLRSNLTETLHDLVLRAPKFSAFIV